MIVASVEFQDGSRIEVGAGLTIELEYVKAPGAERVRLRRRGDPDWLDFPAADVAEVVHQREERF